MVGATKRPSCLGLRGVTGSDLAGDYVTAEISEEFRRVEYK